MSVSMYVWMGVWPVYTMYACVSAFTYRIFLRYEMQNRPVLIWVSAVTWLRYQHQTSRLFRNNCSWISILHSDWLLIFCPNVCSLSLFWRCAVFTHQCVVLETVPLSPATRSRDGLQRPVQGRCSFNPEQCTKFYQENASCSKITVAILKKAHNS
jgi:hypothetical protein